MWAFYISEETGGTESGVGTVRFVLPFSKVIYVGE